ncbi:MAG TPA: hypothetical protein VFR09_07790 [Alphaproteobacteria bacterium]|nr:hypothetical protein [Alphaproteobacteria bacterium]
MTERYLERSHIDADDRRTDIRVVDVCEFKQEDRSRSYYSGRVFACAANFIDVDLSRSNFQEIKFLGNGSIYFHNVSLSKSLWHAADTTKIVFSDANLQGANITVEQLAAARWVDPNCNFPEGIDYRAISEHRAQKGLPAFQLSAPQPA